MQRVTPIIEELHRLPVNPGEGGLAWARRLAPRSPKLLYTRALISRPGAPAQNFHVDQEMGWRSALLPSHRLFNVFVPLVDISADDDGTQFLPGSHLGGMNNALCTAAIQRSGRVVDDELAMNAMEAPGCPLRHHHIRLSNFASRIAELWRSRTTCCIWRVLHRVGERQGQLSSARCSGCSGQLASGCGGARPRKASNPRCAPALERHRGGTGAVSRKNVNVTREVVTRYSRVSPRAPGAHGKRQFGRPNTRKHRYSTICLFD